MVAVVAATFNINFTRTFLALNYSAKGPKLSRKKCHVRQRPHIHEGESIIIRNVCLTFIKTRVQIS